MSIIFMITFNFHAYECPLSFYETSFIHHNLKKKSQKTLVPGQATPVAESRVYVIWVKYKHWPQ